MKTKTRVSEQIARSLIARFRQWHLMAFIGTGMTVALLANGHYLGALAMDLITLQGVWTLRKIDRTDEYAARTKADTETM